jgi:hypothetical protein
MRETIAEHLAALPRLSKVALCELWKTLFNASPSPRLRKSLRIPIPRLRTRVGYQRLQLPREPHP